MSSFDNEDSEEKNNEEEEEDDEEDEEEEDDDDDDEEDEEDDDDDEDDEYEDEEDEEEDLNQEEWKIVKTMMFEGKPKKTPEERTIYDNIIKCLKKKMLNENDKFTDIQKIFEKITDTEVQKMAVTRGSLSIYPEFETTPQTDPTPLFIAAQKGYSNIVELLLSKGADITESVNIKWRKHTGAKYDYFVTPLFVAAMNGHEEIVKAILDKYEEIAPDLKHKYDELNLRPECSRFKNTSIDRVDYSSWEWTSKGEKKKNKKKTPTPLFVAAYAGHCNIIELLVQHKADINWQDDDGMTALFLATKFGELETVKCLLEQGADPNITTGRGSIEVSNGLNIINVNLITPLFMAITRNGAKDEDKKVNFKMVKLLLEHNANVNQPVNRLDNGYTSNITPLQIAEQIAERSSGSPGKSELFRRIIKLLLIENFYINLKVNSMYKVLLSKNIPEDLAAFQSIDMFDKDHISNLAETIKPKAEKKASDKTAKELVAKGGAKINKKCKTNTKKSKKQTKKYTIKSFTV